MGIICIDTNAFWLLYSRLEKQQALAQEKLAAQGGSAGATTVVVTTSTSGLSQTASQIKAQMEQQLKQQRLALQQKRLQVMSSHWSESPLLTPFT